MKPTLEFRDFTPSQHPGKRLNISPDVIAWIRELAGSICLKEPEEVASKAERSQYTWNAAICLAIIEIADQILSGDCSGKDSRKLTTGDAATSAPLS